jgi:hypothetical protein
LSSAPPFLFELTFFDPPRLSLGQFRLSFGVALLTHQIWRNSFGHRSPAMYNAHFIIKRGDTVTKGEATASLPRMISRAHHGPIDTWRALAR